MRGRYLVIGPIGADTADPLEVLLARRARLAAAIEALGEDLLEVNDRIDDVVRRAEGEEAALPFGALRLVR